jgi:phage tail-like protein
MPALTDAYGVSNFRVQIDNITSATFSEVQGLNLIIDSIDYRTGSSPQTTAEKLPGLPHFDNITLKRGLTQNLDLWNWVKNIVNGVSDKRTVQIVLQDAAHNDILRWTVKNAWPCGWSGPAFSTASNDVAIETLVLAHEGFELAPMP